jgi:hypothetical protein
MLTKPFCVARLEQLFVLICPIANFFTVLMKTFLDRPRTMTSYAAFTTLFLDGCCRSSALTVSSGDGLFVCAGFSILTPIFLLQNFHRQYRLYRESLKDASRPIYTVQRLEHLRQLAQGKNFK